ncbi:Shedu anti-phage system protein SduA domain-containing protein [Cryptosporangium sp. NPDC048952]|uniref:Shedu anti-phage system protein SduA domain-containing protein n=1 Tax=Cryptosporangium sp. NPDC048952 TaxID=3363961 RepID=UPI003713977E
MVDRVYGEIPGYPPGSTFSNRIDLANSGVHRPLQAGISGGKDGADSIVVSGGYIDDEDYGDEVVYTGQGGNHPVTGRQIAHQQLNRGNLGLVRSQEEGRLVRLTRGAGGDPRYSPLHGLRYDGLFRVMHHWYEPGIDGYRIWRFRMVAQKSERSPLGIELLNGRLRIVSEQPDGTVKLAGSAGQVHNLLYVVTAQTQQWRKRVKELEDLINSPRVREHDLQVFFEQNPDFLFDDLYESAYPQIVLQRDHEGPLIPDFALKPTNTNALCDLLEIKLPKVKLIRESPNRVRLSSAIMEACAQLREYRDYFEDPERRKSVREEYGLDFFRPRMIVLIGHRRWHSATDLRKAETDVPNLSIVTYDDILERARARLRRR